MKYFFILLVCSISTLSAQPKFDDVDIINGPIFKASKRSVPNRFIGRDATGFYVEYAKGKFGQGEKSIYKFGYDLNPITNAPLKFYSEKLPTYSDGVFMLKGDLYQISRASTFSEQKFFLTRIDSENLGLNEPLHFGSLKPETKSATLSKSMLGFSRDSSFFSYVYTIPKKRKEAEEFGVFVFDNKADLNWTKTFELPYTNKLLDVTTHRIDNDGNLHLLAKRYFDKRREKRAGEPNYDFLLFKVSSDGSIDSTKLEAEGKYLRDMQMEISDDGDLIAAGFYSEQSNLMSGGAFYMRIDGDTKKVMASSFKAFDIDFLAANLKEKKAEKLKKKIEDGKEIELPAYYIDELIAGEDGTTRMIGEKRQIVTHYVYTQYGTTTYTSYYYEDMVAVQIDGNGEIVWAERIAKKQHTSRDGAAYSSYALLDSKDQTILLFNDNAKNATYNGVGNVARMVKGSVNVLMMAKIDNSGNITRKGLINQGEADIKMRPDFSLKLNDNEILIFGHKGLKTQRFILMKFK